MRLQSGTIPMSEKERDALDALAGVVGFTRDEDDVLVVSLADGTEKRITDEGKVT